MASLGAGESGQSGPANLQIHRRRRCEREPKTAPSEKAVDEEQDEPQQSDDQLLSEREERRWHGQF